MVSKKVGPWLGVLALAVTVLTGCPEAKPVPLTADAVNQALAPPALETLRVQATELHHPLLRPVTLGDRAGLAPDEAAIMAVLSLSSIFTPNSKPTLRPWACRRPMSVTSAAGLVMA